MIWCCFATAWASSSSTELLVNGEGHHCRWFIYSPSEAFRLLKSISCADKLTYWSKATNHVICWSGSLEDAGVKETLCVYCHHPWGRENNIKTSSKKQHFFSAMLRLPSLKKQMGDFLQDARSWKLNFGLRDGKLRLRVPDTKPNKLRLDRTVKAVLELRQVRLLVLSVGVGTANMRNKPVQPQPRRTSDSTSCLNHEADQICTWYRPLTSSRHVNFQRCVFSDQTWRRLASGVRRVCRHVFQISAKLWIIQRKFKKENVAGRSGPTGESAVWTPSPERGASAARLRAQRARRSSPTLPTTHLCLLLRDAPPGICFLLLLFYRKSHREMMRGLSSRSAALLFRRALVSWLTAHPVCARRRSCSALSAHGCCCIGCKFKKKKKRGKRRVNYDLQPVSNMSSYRKTCSLDALISEPEITWMYDALQRDCS